MYQYKEERDVVDELKSMKIYILQDMERILHKYSAFHDIPRIIHVKQPRLFIFF